jgi:hypothetical protein
VVLVAINKGATDKATFKTSLPDGRYHDSVHDNGADLVVSGGQATVQLNQWDVGIWATQ